MDDKESIAQLQQAPARYTTKVAVLVALAVGTHVVVLGEARAGVTKKTLRYIDVLAQRRASGYKAPRQHLMERAGALGGSPEQVAATMYEGAGPAVVKVLRQLGPGFERLAYHPGLAIRLASFRKYVTDNNLRGTNPEEALARFREYLGYRTVYRGLALSEESLRKVLSRGLESSFVRFDYDYHFDVTQSPAVRKGLSRGGSRVYLTPDLGGPADPFFPSLPHLIRSRLVKTENPVTHPLISVTDVSDVATAMSLPYARGDKRLYLFKLRVPELDLFYTRPRGVLKHQGSPTTFDLLYPDRKTTLGVVDRATESFLLFKVNADEIESYSLVDPKSIPRYTPPPFRQ